MKKILLPIFIIFLQGCIFVPVIDSFKRAGLTESDRKALLPQSIKRFHDALNWASVNEAMAFVEPENSENIYAYLQRKAEEEKVVESKVSNIKFEDSAYKAQVDMKIRSYRVPVYVVSEKTERQSWNFSGGQWKLSEISQLNE